MSKTIMIVDDDPNWLELVKTIFGKEKYTIITAVDGEDCLKKLKTGKKPDLILMDIIMPGTPVKEVVSKIRSTKIAYFTSVGMSDEQKAELKTDNAVDFIEKSVDNKELVKRVKKIIG